MLVFGPWAGRIAVFLGCCLLFLANPTPASADEGPSQAQRKVTVGVTKSFPPYYQQDEDGKLSGFAIDAMNEVAKRAGFKVTYRVVKNAKALLKGIRSGDMDIIPSLGFNEHRKKYMAFTRPVDTFRVVLFVRNDTQGVTGIDDMKGRPVAAVVGNVGYRHLEKRTDIKLKVFSDFADALFALLSAKVDAFAYPEPVAWKLAREAGVSDRIKVAAKPLFETKRPMAVRKDKKELLAVLDRAVRDFVASPEYQKIYLTWFGKPDPFWTVARVVWTMGGAMAVLFVSMLWWRYRAGVRMIRALSKSEQRFRAVVDSSPAAITLKDRDGRYILVNKTYGEWMDTDPSEMVGLKIQDLFPKQQADDIDSHDRRVIETGESVVAERTRLFRDGVTRTVLLHKCPIFSDTGEIIAVASVITDITDLKKGEEDNRRLAEAIDGLSENFALYGPDDRLVICNQGYSKLNEAIPEATRPGISYEEHMRAVVAKGLAPKAMGREEDYIRERMEFHRNPTGPYEVVRQDRVWLVHEQRVADGSTATIATDITENKRSEMRFRRYFEQPLVGSAIYAPDKKWISVNDALCDLLGYDREELMEITWPEITHPDDLAENLRLFEATLSGTGSDAYSMDKRFIRKDGSVVHTSICGQCIRTLDGAPDYFILLVQDITERQHAYDALLDAKIEAEQANNAKSEFLSSMSHELRTPLNAVLGFTQLLNTDQKHPLTPHQIDATEQILKAGDHLLNLIDEVLDLAQIESGNAAVNAEPQDPTAIVGNCVSIARTLVEQKGLTFYDRATGWKLPEINIDETRFRQVLLNLISNAIKYNRDGGTVTVAVEEGQEGLLRISVADSGMGIAVEKHEQIFTPFSRLGLENSDISGTGIGLTITKELVEAMGGTIGFESTLNLGSTFWVEFPIVSGELTAKASHEPSAAALLEIKHTVLCVEDNPSSLKLLEMIIGRIPDTAMISAHTGELGVDLAEIHRPDVIMMDLNLPGMDGIDALKRLKASSATKDIPVIALTARASDKDKDEGLEVGFADYLTKPINVMEVSTVLNRTFQGA